MSEKKFFHLYINGIAHAEFSIPNCELKPDIENNSEFWVKILLVPFILFSIYIWKREKKKWIC